MKVLGKGKNSTYICEVSHTELSKYFNDYTGASTSMNIGDEINLGLGHDFLREIRDAIRKHGDLIEANRTVMSAITRGFKLLAVKTKPDTEEDDES